MAVNRRLRIETLHVRLGLARRLRIPAWAVETGVDGPALLLVAAQHGNVEG